MSKRYQLRAFTLIELLVVISIIGMLSSVVLSSLNSARNKARNATVKNQLSQARTAAALLFENTGSFDTLCTAGTNTGDMYRTAHANGTLTADQSMCISSAQANCFNNLTNVNCAVAPTGRWAMVVQLRGTGTWFCVDSNGVAREQTTRGVDFSVGGTLTDTDCVL
jgi:prepilin-type N-terminal cleavage/methylation domain-containing protein